MRIDKAYTPTTRTYFCSCEPTRAIWLPPGHLADFISDAVDELSYPPYSPAMIVEVLVYGYATEVCSSRGLGRTCAGDMGLGCWRHETRRTSGRWTSVAGKFSRSAVAPDC